MEFMHIRTRFAPSPTGFIHLGNLRSALYPWAFARHNQGDFILRIEDTDLERSSQEAVDVIIEGMAWLGLDIDEGPIYQMQRIDRYREVVKQMLEAGLAYPCYMSEEELNKLRDQQMANKEKPRYNGLWRPEPGKTLPAIPEGIDPVIRFKNPIGGSVIWEDAARIDIESDAPWWVVYTEDSDGVCIEPQTAPPDAANLGIRGEHYLEALFVFTAI
jgi:glutamyl-tRNA synthetase